MASDTVAKANSDAPAKPRAMAARAIAELEAGKGRRFGSADELFAELGI